MALKALEMAKKQLNYYQQLKEGNVSKPSTTSTSSTSSGSSNASASKSSNVSSRYTNTQNLLSNIKTKLDEIKQNTIEQKDISESVNKEFESQIVNEPINLNPNQQVIISWETKTGESRQTQTTVNRLTSLQSHIEGETMEGRITGVKSATGKVFYNVPTSSQYQTAYQQELRKRYDESSYIPSYIKKQIEIPESIKALDDYNAINEYRNIVYKAQLGYITGDYIDSEIKKLQIKYSDIDWAKKHLNFDDPDTPQIETYESITKNEPAKYLVKGKEGWSFEHNPSRWQKEQHERAVKENDYGFLIGEFFNPILSPEVWNSAFEGNLPTATMPKEGWTFENVFGLRPEVKPIAAESMYQYSKLSAKGDILGMVGRAVSTPIVLAPLSFGIGTAFSLAFRGIGGAAATLGYGTKGATTTGKVLGVFSEVAPPVAGGLIIGPTVADIALTSQYEPEKLNYKLFSIGLGFYSAGLGAKYAQTITDKRLTTGITKLKGTYGRIKYNTLEKLPGLKKVLNIPEKSGFKIPVLNTETNFTTKYLGSGRYLTIEEYSPQTYNKLKFDLITKSIDNINPKPGMRYTKSLLSDSLAWVEGRKPSKTIELLEWSTQQKPTTRLITLEPTSPSIFKRVIPGYTTIRNILGEKLPNFRYKITEVTPFKPMYLTLLPYNQQATGALYGEIYSKLPTKYTFDLYKSGNWWINPKDIKIMPSYTETETKFFLTNKGIKFLTTSKHNEFISIGEIKPFDNQNISNKILGINKSGKQIIDLSSISSGKTRAFVEGKTYYKYYTSNEGPLATIPSIRKSFFYGLISNENIPSSGEIIKFKSTGSFYSSPYYSKPSTQGFSGRLFNENIFTGGYSASKQVGGTMGLPTKYGFKTIELPELTYTISKGYVNNINRFSDISLSFKQTPPELKIMDSSGFLDVVKPSTKLDLSVPGGMGVNIEKIQYPRTLELLTQGRTNSRYGLNYINFLEEGITSSGYWNIPSRISYPSISLGATIGSSLSNIKIPTTNIKTDIATISATKQNTNLLNLNILGLSTTSLTKQNTTLGIKNIVSQITNQLQKTQQKQQQQQIQNQTLKLDLINRSITSIPTITTPIITTMPINPPITTPKYTPPIPPEQPGFIKLIKPPIPLIYDEIAPKRKRKKEFIDIFGKKYKFRKYNINTGKYISPFQKVI